MIEMFCEICGKHPACTWIGFVNFCAECAVDAKPLSLDPKQVSAFTAKVVEELEAARGGCSPSPRPVWPRAGQKSGR